MTASKTFFVRSHQNVCGETSTQSLTASLDVVQAFLVRVLRMLLLAVAGVCFLRSMPVGMAHDVRSAAMPRAEATAGRPA